MLNDAKEEIRIKDQAETQAQNLGERLEVQSRVVGTALKSHGPCIKCNLYIPFISCGNRAVILILLSPFQYL